MLTLVRRDTHDLRELVLAQDVVYVGGGNTANLLALWRLHGVSPLRGSRYLRVSRLVEQVFGLG